MKKGVMVLITVSFLLFLCIYAKNGTDKTVPDMSVSKENNPIEVYEEMDSDYENDTYEENPEEMPVKTCPFTKLYPFSEERAWVNFDKDGITYTGIIDTDGKLLYETENDVYKSQFQDGLSFYVQEGPDESSCGIIDSDGNVTFENQITSDGGYLILAYGNGHFFVTQHIQNFDTDEWRYGTVDKNGNILNKMKRLKSENNEYLSGGDFQEIDYVGEGFISLPHSWEWNEDSYAFYNLLTAETVFPQYAPITEFKNGYTLCTTDAFDYGSKVMSVDEWIASADYDMLNPSSNPNYDKEIGGEFEWSNDLALGSPFYIHGKGNRDMDYGYYDKDWNLVTSLEKYRNKDIEGGPFGNEYAAVTLKGSDDCQYASAVDNSGNLVYDPVKIDNGSVYDSANGYFQVVIDGEDKIIDPEGTIYTPGVDDLSMLKGLTFGDVSEGFIIMDSEGDDSDATPYYVSLDTNTIIDSVKAASTDMDTVEDESLDGEASDNNSYIIPDSYDLTGKWKSIGESGFGQAQPGAIVIFDGSRCNFYSPSDTYAFYYDGDKYVLDVTSPLGESLSWTVNIIDDNNIKVAGARMMRIE